VQSLDFPRTDVNGITEEETAVRMSCMFLAAGGVIGSMWVFVIDFFGLSTDERTKSFIKAKDRPECSCDPRTWYKLEEWPSWFMKEFFMLTMLITAYWMLFTVTSDAEATDRSKFDMLVASSFLLGFSLIPLFFENVYYFHGGIPKSQEKMPNAMREVRMSVMVLCLIPGVFILATCFFGDVHAEEQQAINFNHLNVAMASMSSVYMFVMIFIKIVDQCFKPESELAKNAKASAKVVASGFKALKTKAEQAANGAKKAVHSV
jgi:hypothetical protein